MAAASTSKSKLSSNLKQNADGYCYFKELNGVEQDNLKKGDKVIYCKRHRELTKIENWNEGEYQWNNTFNGECIYCVLENGPNDADFSTDAVNIIKHGYNDYKRDVNYLDICEPCDRRVDFLFYRNLYGFGYKYAEKNYDKTILDLLSEYKHCIEY